jgi:hypothetical protein
MTLVPSYPSFPRRRELTTRSGLRDGLALRDSGFVVLTQTCVDGRLHGHDEGKVEGSVG